MNVSSWITLLICLQFYIFSGTASQNKQLESILKEINGVVYMIAMPERRQHAIESLGALGLYQYMDRVKILDAVHKDSFTPSVIQKMVENDEILTFMKGNVKTIPPHLKVTPGKLAVWKSHMLAHEK
jgi:predicted component of viral defense system (DUF524 family)